MTTTKAPATKAKTATPMNSVNVVEIKKKGVDPADVEAVANPSHIPEDVKVQKSTDGSVNYVRQVGKMSISTRYA